FTRAIRQGSVTPLAKARPGIPGWLAAAVERAIAPDPRERFPDGVSFARALEAGKGRGSRGRRATLVALVLAASVGMGGFAAWRGRARDARPAARPAVAPVASSAPS